MRRIAASLIAVLIVCAPRPADAWGFEVHRFITSRAIALLPAELRPFFERYEVQVVEHSVDPDLWRIAGWDAEPPRHFMDMDAYGPYPFEALPRDFDEAVQRYGRAFVQKNGTLPWRTAEMHAKLVEAFIGKAPYARENIKFFSSVVAHYVADGHVPFHAALNYDGQLTGQRGIHSRFETELFERYRERLRPAPGRVVPIGNPRDFMFDTLVTSFSLVQPILDADKALAADREMYDDGYFDGFFARTRPALERRLAESITHVASMIVDAWQRAGRPAVPPDVPRVPRRIRR